MGVCRAPRAVLAARLLAEASSEGRAAGAPNHSPGRGSCLREGERGRVGVHMSSRDGVGADPGFGRPPLERGAQANYDRLLLKQQLVRTAERSLGDARIQFRNLVELQCEHDALSTRRNGEMPLSAASVCATLDVRVRTRTNANTPCVHGRADAANRVSPSNPSSEEFVLNYVGQLTTSTLTVSCTARRHNWP
eukprot:2616736-Pleurochrysis_carterae.AAC.2